MKETFEFNKRQQEGRAARNFFTKAKNKFCKMYEDTPANRRTFNNHFRVNFINGKYQFRLIKNLKED